MKFSEKYKTDGAFKKKVHKFAIFSVVVILVLSVFFAVNGNKSKDNQNQLGNVVQPDNYVVPDSVSFVEDKSAYYGNSNDSTNLKIPGSHNDVKNPVDNYMTKRNERMDRINNHNNSSRRSTTPPPIRRTVDYADLEEEEVEDFIVEEKPLVKIPTTPTMSEEEKKRQELRDRKLRLETGKSSLDNTKNFNIAINGTQTVKNGQSVAFRVLNDAIIEGRELKKNTLVYGTAKFDDYRVSVSVSSVRIGNEIVPVNMVVFGMDGQQGIPINANQVLEKSKDKAKNEVEREIDKADIPGSRVLTEIFTKDKDVEVKLINNHKLILVTK